MYNADNIARVRRDEAEAKAAETAEEQRMQEVDSERRIAILRGEALPPLEVSDLDHAPSGAPGTSRRSHPRRDRKRHGEDDTDFEIRLASTRAAAGSHLDQERHTSSKSVQLFDQAPRKDGQSLDREERSKDRESEELQNMRFSNAAGRHGSLTPWYSQSDRDNVASASKDAFGRDDPGRKDRDIARMNASDPLAMMKQGAAKVRQLKQERRTFQNEREMELKELRRNDRHRDRAREKSRHNERRRSRSPRSEDRKHRSQRRHRSRDRDSRSRRSSIDRNSRRETYRKELS